MVSFNSPILQKVCIERVECGIGISARKLTSQEDVQNDGYLLASHSPFPLSLITYLNRVVLFVQLLSNGSTNI